MSPVKMQDLCERCKYDFGRWCCSVMRSNCKFCENKPKEGKCRCLTIAENTPCPYFDEAKDE